ncbi:hypothetical protein POM88_051386 [Heracleum sosnowskyi]|uniref:Uncharacterized protein n=1 Tax=Heracleum sosnowskyi TaxID=360622 RepID=A0AAD8GZB4_9APIA|nr:hypothetical protein POM88_051386 [Heracleum sosnowskyi]
MYEYCGAFQNLFIIDLFIYLFFFLFTYIFFLPRDPSLNAQSLFPSPVVQSIRDWRGILVLIDMVSESSPRRRQNSVNPLPFRKHQSDEVGSFSTVVRRHKFLLTACSLLLLLCTIYLYLAVTLGDNDACSNLSETQKSQCHLQQVKEVIAKGKFRIF